MVKGKKTQVKKKKKGVKEEISSTEKEQNKQLIVFFTIMLISLGALIGGYLYIKQANNFTYVGVDFQKGKEGDVAYYYGRFPMNYQSQTHKIFNLYLRLDPRENDIPINTNFTRARKVIVAFEPGMEKCDRAVIGHSLLTDFIRNVPFVKNLSVGVTDEEYAIEKSTNFITCNSSDGDTTVILAKFSNITSIEKESENCYRLNVANCEYLAVTERYVVGLIAQINEEKI